MIYAKENLKTTAISTLTNSEGTDSVWCKIEDLTVGVCYNTTANTKPEDEEPLLELISKACQRGEVVIVGDFNHETIDWELMEAQSEGQGFLDRIQDQFLHQHVDKPTRGNNILDLILSSNPEQVRNITVSEQFGTSDHNIVHFEVIVKEEPKQWKETYRDYRNADFNKIREVASVEWSAINNSSNLQEVWSKFKAALDKVVEENVNVKERIKGRPPKPMWWNRKIYKLRRNRLKWWQKFRESQDETHESRYLAYQKKVVKEVKSAKRRLEERLGRNIKEDRKGFFKYAKSKMKVKEGVGPIEDENGRIMTDEQEMAEEFGRFFKVCLYRRRY